MDGKMMLYQVRQLLQESSTSSFLDDRTTYDFLYEAACQFAMDTRMLTSSTTITTIANYQMYPLNPDYLCLLVRNDNNEYVVRYYDGSNYYWPTYRDISSVWINSATTGSSIPDNFCVVDATVPTTVIQGASIDGALTYGYTILTSALSTFVTDGVCAGDQIHNTTDGSDGVVIRVDSETAIRTALFGGTNNDWTAGDAFVIVPQSKKQIGLDPFSLTSGHTLVVPYVQRPDPVYTSYGAYSIPAVYMPAIVKYAAWLYKYRDREPNFGDAWYKYWEMQLRKCNANENRSPDRMRWGVNYSKNSYGNRSAR